MRLTLMAVREEEGPASLAVEGNEVIHDHTRVLCDAATEHTHPGLESAELGEEIGRS